MRRHLLTFVLVFLTGCVHSAPRPEISVVDAKFTDVTLLETGLQFTLRLSNDSPEPLTIDSATYRFYLGGEDIGSGSSSDTLTVPRFGSVTQKVRVGVSNLAMLGQIRALVESKHFDYRVESEFYFRGQGPFRSERSVVKEGQLDLPRLGGDDAQFDTE